MSVAFDTNSSDVLFTSANLASAVQVTYCFWAKFTAAGAGLVRDLFTLHDAGPTNTVKLDWTSGNTLQVLASTNANFGSTPTIGNWNFYALTAGAAGAGSVIGYFRDNASGSLASQAVTGVSFTPNTLTLGQVGAATSAAEFAYFMEFDNTLSAAQVLTQSSRSTPITSGLTLRRYLALTNAASAGTDTSGNGFNLTVSGALTDGASLPAFPTAAQHYYRNLM